MKNVLPFLIELSENNSREWFNANKDKYQIAHHEFEELMASLITDVQAFDKSIGILKPKECIFRLHRDVRFSHNKQPYKTNFGGVIVRNGRKSPFAGYYLHIDANESFIGGGIYQPMPDILKAIRNEIYFNGKEFNQLINESKFKTHFRSMDDEGKLKNPPKGYDPDFEFIDILKFKNYTVFSEFDAKELTSKDFIAFAVDSFKAMYPLVQFLNRAVNNIER